MLTVWAVAALPGGEIEGGAGSSSHKWAAHIIFGGDGGGGCGTESTWDRRYCTVPSK